MPKHVTQDNIDDDHLDGDNFVFRAKNMTETERDALTATKGMIIYNTTKDEIQGYVNGSWVDLGGLI